MCRFLPAARGDRARCRFVECAQVLLAVGQAAASQLGDAGVVPQRGEDVVQWLAAGTVHLHVAAGHHGNAQVAGQCAAPGSD